MLQLFKRWPSSSKQLPDPVFIELIDLLYLPVVPAVFIGFAIIGIGSLIAVRKQDAIILFIALLGVMISIVRFFLIMLYRRRRAVSSLTRQEAVVWERRFAVASFGLASVIGALDMRALTMEHEHNPMLVPMLISGLIFGYGAGVVMRQAVRPTICFVTLMLAVVPTVMGFGARMVTEEGVYETAVFAAQTLFIAAFALASLESVFDIYKITKQLLISKLDLAELAGKDDLTGLSNRVTLRARFQEALTGDHVPGSLIALHCLDLDRFKAVNDTLGHPIGDLLLKAVAERLTRTMREEDILARLGGDEFIVVQPGIRHADEARLLAHRIIHVVSAPYMLQGHEVQIGVSIGIAIATRNAVNLEHFIALADSALYQTKGRGRGGITLMGEPAPSDEMITAA